MPFLPPTNGEYGLVFAIRYSQANRPTTLEEFWVYTSGTWHCAELLPEIGKAGRNPRLLAALFAATEISRRKGPQSAASIITKDDDITLWAFCYGIIQGREPAYLMHLPCFKTPTDDLSKVEAKSRHWFFSSWFRAESNVIRLCPAYAKMGKGIIQFIKLKGKTGVDDCETFRASGKGNISLLSLDEIQQVYEAFRKPSRKPQGAARKGPRLTTAETMPVFENGKVGILVTHFGADKDNVAQGRVIKLLKEYLSLAEFAHMYRSVIISPIVTILPTAECALTNSHVLARQMADESKASIVIWGQYNEEHHEIGVCYTLNKQFADEHEVVPSPDSWHVMPTLDVDKQALSEQYHKLKEVLGFVSIVCGQEHYRRAEIPDATRHFETALRLSPPWPLVSSALMFLLAQCYCLSGQFMNATNMLARMATLCLHDARDRTVKERLVRALTNGILWFGKAGKREYMEEFLNLMEHLASAEDKSTLIHEAYAMSLLNAADAYDNLNQEELAQTCLDKIRVLSTKSPHHENVRIQELLAKSFWFGVSMSGARHQLELMEQYLTLLLILAETRNYERYPSICAYAAQGMRISAKTFYKCGYPAKAFAGLEKLVTTVLHWPLTPDAYLETAKAFSDIALFCTQKPNNAGLLGMLDQVIRFAMSVVPAKVESCQEGLANCLQFITICAIRMQAYDRAVISLECFGQVIRLATPKYGVIAAFVFALRHAKNLPTNSNTAVLKETAAKMELLVDGDIGSLDFWKHLQKKVEEEQASPDCELKVMFWVGEEPFGETDNVGEGYHCDKCWLGIFRFSHFGSGPHGPFTAWFNCDTCDNSLYGSQTLEED